MRCEWWKIFYRYYLWSSCFQNHGPLPKKWFLCCGPTDLRLESSNVFSKYITLMHLVFSCCECQFFPYGTALLGRKQSQRCRQCWTRHWGANYWQGCCCSCTGSGHMWWHTGHTHTIFFLYSDSHIFFSKIWTSPVLQYDSWDKDTCWKHQCVGDIWTYFSHWHFCTRMGWDTGDRIGSGEDPSSSWIHCFFAGIV